MFEGEELTAAIYGCVLQIFSTFILKIKEQCYIPAIAGFAMQTYGFYQCKKDPDGDETYYGTIQHGKNALPQSV